jgi:hypothetical protein
VEVALDLVVEPRRVEAVEPRAKTRQVAWGQTFNCFLDVFDGTRCASLSLSA